MRAMLKQKQHEVEMQKERIRMFGIPGIKVMTPAPPSTLSSQESMQAMDLRLQQLEEQLGQEQAARQELEKQLGQEQLRGNS